MQQAVDTCIVALQCDSLCFWIVLNVKVFTVFTVEGVELSTGSGEERNRILDK
jgi:hypothetical protein